MKIHYIVRYNVKRMFRRWWGVKEPSKGPPYYDGNFLWKGNLPAHIHIARKRHEELTADLKRFENDHREQMAAAPGSADSYLEWYRRTTQEMFDKQYERAFLAKFMRRHYEKSGVRHSLTPENEDSLLIYGLDKAIDISYATLHADKFPPKSIADAEARIHYLKDQDHWILRKILSEIKEEGRRLRCNRKAVTRAQRPVLLIEAARINETRMLERWVDAQKAMVAESQPHGESGDALGLNPGIA